MLDDGGRYLHPPPPWAPLFEPQLGSTLMDLVDMTRSDPGRIMTLDGLRAWLAAESTDIER